MPSPDRSRGAQQYYFRDYQVEDGLSHNTVFCVVQDKQGYVWAGTKDGLNRFDGREFRVFREKPGTHPPSATISYSHYAWMTTDSCMPALAMDYTVTLPPRKASKGRPLPLVRMPTRSGQTAREPVVPELGRLYRYDPTRNASDPVTDSYIPGGLSALHISKKGNIWVANGGGEIRMLGDSVHRWDVWRHSPNP